MKGKNGCVAKPKRLKRSWEEYSMGRKIQCSPFFSLGRTCKFGKSFPEHGLRGWLGWSMWPALCQDFYFILFYPVVSWVAVKYKYKKKGFEAVKDWVHFKRKYYFSLYIKKITPNSRKMFWCLMDTNLFWLLADITSHPSVVWFPDNIFHL